MPGDIKPGSIAAGAAAVVAAILVLWLWPGANRAPEASLPRVSDTISSAPATPLTTPEVVVHLSGSVASPGVYRLTPGMRLVDLIESAGGETIDADLDRLNLAEVLHDGDRIHVPAVGEDSEPQSFAADSSESSQVVDINTAEAAELERLPGIGPALAAAIVEDRETRGPFASVDELDRVSGIGPAKLDRLRDHVRV